MASLNVLQDSHDMTEYTTPEPVAAKRLEHNPWRDKRVIIGIAVVLTSAVLGGLLSLKASATETYWVAARDLRAGHLVTAGDMRRIEVSVPNEVGDALVAGASTPSDGVWSHDLEQGTLIGASSIRRGPAEGQRLPLRVAAGSLPAGLTTGDTVNVWVGPGQNSSELDALRVLTEVRVAGVAQEVGSVDTTVLVDVGEEGPTSDVISAIASGHVTVVHVR